LQSKTNNYIFKNVAVFVNITEINYVIIKGQIVIINTMISRINWRKYLLFN